MESGKAGNVPLHDSPIKVRMKAMNTTEDSLKGTDSSEMPPPPPPLASTSTQQMAPPPAAERKPKYETGILIWAKMTGHPWWPCMVTTDPLLKIHSKTNARGQVTYHCQFFGAEAERGWVTESATMEFQGKENFQRYVENQINTAGTKAQRKTLLQKFEIRPGRRHAWDASAIAADQALTIKDIEERKRLYTFRYSDLPDDLNQVTPSTVTSQPARTAAPLARNAAPLAPPPAPAKAAAKATAKPSTKPSAKPPAKRKQSEPAAKFAKKPKHSVINPKTSKPNYTAVKSPVEALQKSNVKVDDPFAFDEPDIISPPASRMLSPPKLMRLPSVLPAKKKSRNISTSSSTSASSRDKKVSSSPSVPPSSAPKPKATTVGDSSPLPTTFEIYRLTATSSIRKEIVCGVCEKGANVSPKLGELVGCTGNCQLSFHRGCATIVLKDTFKCTACSTGIHDCFLCKQPGGTVQRCASRECGRFYHMDCMKHHPLAVIEDKKLYCPLHICASCARGDPNNERACVGKLYKCVRCPAAYHTGDFCVAAGSQVLAGHNIICSNHFQKDKKNATQQTHINVNWCFNCSQGKQSKCTKAKQQGCVNGERKGQFVILNLMRSGTLVCCETCPAAFHTECLRPEENPAADGLWFCNDCKHGVRPRYGDIVWVKLGSYRWWPSEICHPEHVPLNIQQRVHDVGEFAVHFFGSNDYNWMHRGRVFPYQEGDKGSKESIGAKNINKLYKLALQQASEGYTEVTTIRASKDQRIAKICDSKPRRYKYIKTNLPIPPVKLNKMDKEQIPVCECKPELGKTCGDNDACLNRLLYYECHPATCPAGAHCENQRFQRRRYPKQEPFKTGDVRGWGLKAKVDIVSGQFVNEYVGELVTVEECKKRIEKYHEENFSTFYMLTLDSNRVIDAGPKGNLARFGNHSCEPNMKTQKWFVNGNWKVGLFATQDIAAETELTFNYNLVSVGETKLKCLCKARTCSGFIGERTIKSAGNDKPVKPKKKKRHLKLKHDEWCYRCLDGGKLLMCNRVKCPRAYHLACLGLDKIPYGKWDCPWHHCDDCGKISTMLCSECPNSFCNEHYTRNIQKVQGVWFCRSHSVNDISHALAEHAKKLPVNSAPSTPGSSTSTDTSTSEIVNYLNPLGNATDKDTKSSKLNPFRN